MPPRFEYGRAAAGPRRDHGPLPDRAVADAAGHRAASSAAVAVDSVGKNFSWSVRRDRRASKSASAAAARARASCASRRRAASRGCTCSRCARARARPRRRSSCSRRQQRDVLVVLPVTTWQGLNPVDDDGDGRPNTLGAGLPVRVARPFVKDGLPAADPPPARRCCSPSSTARATATTSRPTSRSRAARAASSAGYRGVILAGDTRWLDVRVARRCAASCATAGACCRSARDSLRRTRDADAGRARDRPDAADAARPLRRAPAADRAPGPLTLVNITDGIDLFAGTAGQFAGIGAFEQTIDVRGGTSAIAAAAAAAGRAPPGDRRLAPRQGPRDPPGHAGLLCRPA